MIKYMVSESTKHITIFFQSEDINLGYSTMFPIKLANVYKGLETIMGSISWNKRLFDTLGSSRLYRLHPIVMLNYATQSSENNHQ